MECEHKIHSSPISIQSIHATRAPSLKSLRHFIVCLVACRSDLLLNIATLSIEFFVFSTLPSYFVVWLAHLILNLKSFHLASVCGLTRRLEAS